MLSSFAIIYLGHSYQEADPKLTLLCICQKLLRLFGSGSFVYLIDMRLVNLNAACQTIVFDENNAILGILVPQLYPVVC